MQYKQKREIREKKIEIDERQTDSQRPFTSHIAHRQAPKCAPNLYFITSFICNSIALSINYYDVHRAAEWSGGGGGGDSLYCKDRYRLQAAKKWFSRQMKQKKNPKLTIHILKSASTTEGTSWREVNMKWTGRFFGICETISSFNHKKSFVHLSSVSFII